MLIKKNNITEKIRADNAELNQTELQDALVELADLFAEQDDALVELADLLSEGAN